MCVEAADIRPGRRAIVRDALRRGMRRAEVFSGLARTEAPLYW